MQAKRSEIFQLSEFWWNVFYPVVTKNEGLEIVHLSK